MSICLYWSIDFPLWKLIITAFTMIQSPWKTYILWWRKSLINLTKRLPWSDMNGLVASLFPPFFLPSQSSRFFWMAPSPQARDSEEIHIRTNKQPLWLPGEHLAIRASIPNTLASHALSCCQSSAPVSGFQATGLPLARGNQPEFLSAIQTCLSYPSNLVILWRVKGDGKDEWMI